MKTRHDGDCYVYSSRICTCGLLHQLAPHDDPTSVYPAFDAEYGRHQERLDAVREVPIPPPATDEQVVENTKLLGELFGKTGAV